MPDHHTIQSYCTIIEDHIKKNQKNIDFWQFSYNLDDLRCGIDFRKYVFWYIKWYDNTKDVKQALISTKDISNMYTILDNF
jgi:hypothetical protein